ncbi:MAG: stage III sporulation protein AD [Lachnospiraceae bacterium]|nr:stage III sporulation protein AD [Lachnospiraceae bacterium]
MSIGAMMAVIVVAVIMALSLKSRNPEISSLISVAICISIIGLCVSRIGTIIDTISTIARYINIDSSYMLILLKLIGIAYICEFASGISKDAGYSAVASQIELTGKITMLMVSLPVLMQVVETILGMM